jgi:hypothetical protein
MEAIHKRCFEEAHRLVSDFEEVKRALIHQPTNPVMTL